MKLTTKFVQSITEPGRYYDDAAPGLFVLAQRHRGPRGESIRLSFVQRLTIQGKRRDIGLGSPKWNATTLTEARRRAMENYRIARHGGDPRVGKRRVPSFADGVETVLAIQREAWKDNGKSERQWRSSLTTYADSIMAKTVDAIGPGDVLAVLVPHWSSKRETMRRVKQRVSAVMRWAIAEGHRGDDPTLALSGALPKNGVHKAHHKAAPYGEMSAILSRVRESAAYPTTKLAFEFLVLCAARSGEVRGMVWSEIDVEACTWTVPASRMKASKAHKVPLSDRAIEVLAETRQYSDGAPDSLVFPAPRGGMLSDMTMSKLCKSLSLGMVPHGARSSFRDWTAECTSFPREVCEEALAHVNPNKVESAYRRSTLEAKRRELMQAWAAYLTRDRAGKVVALRG